VTTEPLNHRQWPADRTGVYEVWYLTWNHAPSGQGFWLRYISEAPSVGEPRSELWFARFDPKDPSRTFGVHRRFAPLASTVSPFAVTIDKAVLHHDRATGELAGDGHAVSWDLRWQPAVKELRQLPDPMYGGAAGRGETTVLSPNPYVAMSGRVVVDGESIDFKDAVLGQTHLWGTKHAYSWTWGRCAELKGAPGALLELLGVRLKRGVLTLPPLVLVALDLDGEQHRFNQFRHVVRNRGTWGGSRVTFEGIGGGVKIAGELACAPSRMVSAPYLDPDGTRVFCANTEIGDARVTISRRAGLGWREERSLEGLGTAHFEVGGRTRDPAVEREHVLAS
jgi:Tocopherol cyclase